MAAQVVTLAPGVTNSIPAGRVLAVEAVTVDATQQVALDVVTQVQDWTNGTVIAVNYATNYLVCASNLATAVTNLTTVPRPPEQFAWVNSTILWVSTNDVSTAITNTWRARGEMYTVTTNVFTASAAGHYLKESPESLYLLNGLLSVSASSNDVIRVLIGD